MFVSDRDGLPQLYIADAARPDGPATRLVTSTERMTAGAFTPDGKALVYRSDHGADENWRSTESASTASAWSRSS